MRELIVLSSCMIPFVIFGIVVYGIWHKVAVYDVFVTGAQKGMQTVVSILPTLVGLMVAVGVLRSSGFLDFLAQILQPLTKWLHIPSQVFTLIVVRLFSSSAATGLALDIFKEYGTDSYIGLMTSLLMACTETCFYTMSVYFMAAKVTKTRWTLAGALLATCAGIAASVLLAGKLL